MEGMQNRSLEVVEVAFGDVLVRLYRFYSDYRHKNDPTLHIPILHTHLFYEMMLCFEYEYRILFSDGDVRLAPHSFLMVAPSTEHCAAGTEGIPALSLGIGIRKTVGYPRLFDRVVQLFQEAGRSVHRLSLETENATRRFYSVSGYGTRALCLAKVYAYELAYSILEDIGALADVPLQRLDGMNGSTEERLAIMIDDRTYTLKQMAEILGYTERHVLRFIKKRYGCGYRELRRKRVLEAAKVYLASDRYVSVKEIAASLGYDSESTFYSFFKRETGYTPRQYRLAIRKGEKIE